LEINNQIMRLFISCLLYLFFAFAKGQSRNITLEECKKNQLREKAFMLQNKFTQVEIKHYCKDQNHFPKKKLYWELQGKAVYEYDANATLISRKFISVNFDGNEIVTWQGKYIYNNMGICDSATADNGTMFKVGSLPSLMYPACYNGKRKLKNGLTIKYKREKIRYVTSYPTKSVYTFK